MASKLLPAIVTTAPGRLSLAGVVALVMTGPGCTATVKVGPPVELPAEDEGHYHHRQARHDQQADEYTTPDIGDGTHRPLLQRLGQQHVRP